MSSQPRAGTSNRRKTLQVIGTVTFSVIGAIAALAAILQFLGITPHLTDFLPQPAKTPRIPLAVYDTIAPGCDTKSDPPYLHWLAAANQLECTSGNTATILHQTDKGLVGIAALRADNYTFAPDETITLVVKDLSPNVCAAVGSRGSINTNRQYAFYTCGDGNWYIIKYSPGSGTPLVLGQSSAENKDTITGSATLAVTLSGSILQLVVNNGQAHLATDPEFTDTGLIGILCAGEDALETNLPGSILASITITHFRYQEL